MQQVDLELTDPVFGDGRVGGDVLLFALQIDVAEELAEILEFIQREDGVGVEALAGIGEMGGTAESASGSTQVEFEFGGGPAAGELGIAADNAGEGLARVREEGRVDVLEEPERDHGAGPGGPVDDRQRAPRPVVAQMPSVSPPEKTMGLPTMSFPHTSTPTIESGMRMLFLGDPAGLVDGDALAAHDAVEIADRRVEDLDLRVVGQPGDDVGVVVLGGHAR